MSRAIALRMAKAGLLRKTVAKISPVMTMTAEYVPEFRGMIYGKTEYRTATPREVRIALREQRAGRDWRFAL